MSHLHLTRVINRFITCIITRPNACFMPCPLWHSLLMTCNNPQLHNHLRHQSLHHTCHPCLALSLAHHSTQDLFHPRCHHSPPHLELRGPSGCCKVRQPRRPRFVLAPGGDNSRVHHEFRGPLGRSRARDCCDAPAPELVITRAIAMAPKVGSSRSPRQWRILEYLYVLASNYVRTNILIFSN